MDPNVLNAFLTLSFIVVGLTVVLIIVKRYAAANTAKGDGPDIRVLHRLALQPKKSLCVVLVVDRILVLGLSDDSITTLAEISDQESVQRLMREPAHALSATGAAALAKKLHFISPSAAQRNATTREPELSFAAFVKSIGRK